MNEDMHKVLHGGVTDRLDKLEDAMDQVNLPEDGTLAKMRASIHGEMSERVEKVESKLNWLIVFLMTTVVGALSTIVMAKLGFK